MESPKSNALEGLQPRASIHLNALPVPMRSRSLRLELRTSMTDVMQRAVVLLSGGLDSSTTLAIAKSEGYDIYALSFRYGQRHQAELEAARRVAKHFDTPHHVIAGID